MISFGQIRFPRKTVSIGNIPLPNNLYDKEFTVHNLYKEYSLTEFEKDALHKFRISYCANKK